jgi:hypothetical protein
MARKLSHDQWSAYLNEPGQKLTLDEFRALEAACAHDLLIQIAIGLGMFRPAEGQFAGDLQVIRGVLDGLLKRAVAQQRKPPPDARPAVEAQPRPPAQLRVVGPDHTDEGG